MRTALALAWLALCASTSHAEQFRVGDQEIQMPSPEGFVRVTPAMKAYYWLSQQATDPLNEQLAFYIPAAQVSKTQALQRYCVGKVSKRLQRAIVSREDFKEIKNLVKQENKEIIEEVKSEVSSHVDAQGKRIGEQLAIDFAMRISRMVPLDPHYEAESVLGYSMYVNFGVTGADTKEEYIAAVTSVLTHVAGKILYLYCYGKQSDLAWTRTASQAWAERVVSLNPRPPAATSGPMGVWEKAWIGAAIGGLIALVAGLGIKYRKKKPRV